jgi:hypothetical protein
MVTLETLRARTLHDAALPQPARNGIGGARPTRWSVRYDRATHRYDVAFEGLTS